MKKLTFLFALLLSSAFAFAGNNQSTTLARVNYENTKMYRQAGTSTEILKSLKSTDELVVVRKHNALWTIVTVDGQVGYVLTSELSPARDTRSLAMARNVRKK
jgi:hypothetical protein